MNDIKLAEARCANCTWWGGRSSKTNECHNFTEYDENLEDVTGWISSEDNLWCFYTGPSFGCTRFELAKNIVLPFDPFDL